MAIYVFLMFSLNVIIALAAIGVLKALQPQKMERDVIRLTDGDVNVQIISDLSRQGYRVMVLRANLAILVGEFESERPSYRRKMRQAFV